MIFNSTPIENLFVIAPALLEDDRGWFFRTYCKKDFEQIGHIKEWVQMNHSYTKSKGSIRGMHFQTPPFSEIKLVRCVAGKVFDIAVDLRKGSSTFLKWFGVELSAENKKMFYIPEGFAHGFQTLSDNCELVYCHSQFYNKEFERALRFDDPALNINWKLPVQDISEKDKNHPLINSDFKGIEI